MNRGEIWWADLPTPERSEPGYRRPVLVIQSNAFNESKIRTVICASITSNTRLANMPGNVLLKPKESNLSQESIVNVSQVITLDRSFFIEYVGSVSAATVRKVNAGLKVVLDLE